LTLLRRGHGGKRREGLTAKAIALLLGLGSTAAPVFAGGDPDAGARSCTVRLEFVREGQHVAGLHFALHGSRQESLRGVTDVQGWATLVLPEGEWTMYAPRLTAEGFEPFSVTCPGAAAHVRLELPRRTALRGRVVDVKGAPVAGAEVVGLGAIERLVDLEPYSDRAWKVLTDRDGRFELTYFGDSVRLTASTSKARSEVVVTKGDRVTLVVAEAERFSPRVVGPAAAHRYVELTRRGGPSISTVLDEPGQRALQLTVGSYTALVRLEAEGRTWSGQAAFDVVPGTPVTPVITLQPVVLEVVVTRSGKPVAGVPVEVVSEGWPALFSTHQSDRNWAGSGVTARDGVVTISPKLYLASPTFVVRVTPPGTARQVQAVLGGPRVTIELSEQVDP
jgi:hypothetical protein